MATPLINLKPTNPTQEEFMELQSFGLQPYDRSPNDYLRFVAKIFTAWRDPDDKILNFDPYDTSYMENDPDSTILQTTSDKSIIAYVDGFKTSYYFTRLTTDQDSVDLTSADNVIETPSTITYFDDTGETITLDKARYGEYHRFTIAAGTCFIDNQLIEIKEDTEWWFRVPDITTVDGEDTFSPDGTPKFEAGQFITNQTKVYSLLPSEKYKIILSYKYVNQFESNTAWLRFVSANEAIDEPYLLIGTFSTNEFGMVHQTQPVNESNKEIYLNYISKLDEPDIYYLRDIDNQYLDKKYMANHKNLFKHMQSQLLTILSDSKIANTFHVKTIEEEIDHSVSSGDFVWFDSIKNRWFPAIVSRQDFDRVQGLYLKNSTEGTDLLFTSGIIEIDSTYKIVNSENMVLKNLIPGTEYFLADDKSLIEDSAPFISPFGFTITEDYFAINTSVIAKATSIDITFMNNPDAIMTPFEMTRSFPLDPILGEQRKEQSILWELDDLEKGLLPLQAGGYQMISPDTGLVATDKVQFSIKINMALSELEETQQDVINAFQVNDIEFTLPYSTTTDTIETIHDIKITSSDIDLEVMNLVPNLVGPKKPISSLLSVLDVESPNEYSQFNIEVGDKFLDYDGTDYSIGAATIEAPLISTLNALDTKLYSVATENDGESFGLNNKLALLGASVSALEESLLELDESLDLSESFYKDAKMEFQSTASAFQEDITEKRSNYLGYLNTLNSLKSQKYILEQKYSDVEVRVQELITERNSLQDAYNNSDQAEDDLTNVIAIQQAKLDTLNSDITTLTTEIQNIATDITSYTNSLDTTFGTVDSETTMVMNYKSNYFRVLNVVSADYDLTDQSKITQRVLHSMLEVKDSTKDLEEAEAELTLAKIEYENALYTYTQDVVGGTLSFAEQLIRMGALSTIENLYNDKQDLYDFINKDLLLQRGVRGDIYPLFQTYKDTIKGELFAEIKDNDSSTSTWAVTKLITFTAKIDAVSTEDIDFSFIYKEDTNDTAVITIPAGQTMASFSVYLNTFPMSSVDNGMPKWVTNIDVVNLNSINENLLNDTLITSTNTIGQKLFTIDTSMYGLNPHNREGSIHNVSVLNSIEDLTTEIYDLQLNRETSSFEHISKKEEKELKEDLQVYQASIVQALNDMLNTGTTTMNNYQLEIDQLNARILYLNTTTDILNPKVYRSEFSKDSILALISALDTNISGTQLLTDSTKVLYEEALKALADATKEELNSYTITIEKLAETKKEQETKKEEIKILFDVYEEKVNILISIYNNLKSIHTSGIFNGEWTKFNNVPLNSIEYQDGLENILIETMDFLALLPYSGFNVADTLEYICSPNGVAYPTDLQLWIFTKSSGKISTKKYPGATSVGIALNNNTLILNIQHNQVGDISEFLNVYGNGSDFIQQLEAIYQTNSGVEQKTNLILAETNLNSKISILDELLLNNSSSVQREINGSTITIDTTLVETEMDTITTMVSNVFYREVLIRLVYAKYFNDTIFNPMPYLLNTDDSSSAWYHTTGNPNLENSIDPFNPEFGKTFVEYIQPSMDDISMTGLDQETLKDLFFRKNPLSKDRDIIRFILASLPEPLFNYQARGIVLKEDFTSIVLKNLEHQRLVAHDTPEWIDEDGEFHSGLDNFENPAITNPEDLVEDSVKFTELMENKRAEIDTLTLDMDTQRLNHDTIVKDTQRYIKYKKFYQSLIYTMDRAIALVSNKKYQYESLKSYFQVQLIELNREVATNYRKTDKRPNIMWDVFRVTNQQRTKWNYTYLVLRIKGMQQELNNILISNVIQYSPINAEINELKIKKNAALTDGNETLSFVYQTEIDASLLKKNHFQSLLDNYVSEFNIIQRNYSYDTITSELELTDSIVIPELYMQDPDEYNLSYAFSEYPAYNEA